MFNRPIGLISFAAAFMAFGLANASAASMKISADLKGSSETPPNDSKGTGTLTGTFDPDSKKLSWEITYSGLTGPGTTAHFHAPASVGKSAPPVIAIKPPAASPIKGDATLTDAQVKDLTDGMTYFNVHSDKYPKGEIRGQVMVAK